MFAVQCHSEPPPTLAHPPLRMHTHTLTVCSPSLEQGSQHGGVLSPEITKKESEGKEGDGGKAKKVENKSARKEIRGESNSRSTAW